MKSQIGLKNSTKPFPLGTDVGVLKWRYQTQDDSALPLTSNFFFPIKSFYISILSKFLEYYRLAYLHLLYEKITFSVNCWPSENGQGGCDVNIEYELEHTHLELNDVTINIPLP